MSFFRKIFSRNKNSNQENNEVPQVKEIFTEEYFDSRYTEQELSENDLLVDGSSKMLESFFIDNKIKPVIDQPVYHPLNIDQAVQDGMGFYEYCKQFDQDDKQIGLIITIAFSYFLVNEWNFKLFNDKTPEFPLRFMTLKYNRNGGVLSLYPFEYSLKVLNGEERFSDLFEKIKNNLGNIPSAKDILDNLKRDLNQE
ncbi:hypothetical protein [Chryseobacterium profundimaris]|uniref:Uncharacterized protein n=1 Tax=Chryseobacterium profundimaris TaxID=1387275 RepID=A0ABY1NQM0_9FLAO|nr:hypothetical protein [Chryseobacterium profundimaris]SMP15689.1 hypothetical protein SAMN06264346_103185 [Chryseobacterium profundimaris]